MNLKKWKTSFKDSNNNVSEKCHESLFIRHYVLTSFVFVAHRAVLVW